LDQGWAKDGKTLTQTTENKKQSYKCTNCKKEFDNPVIIQRFACPFCMAEMEEKPLPNSGCMHYFRYLNERPKGQDIPMECLTCKQTIECMLSPKSDSAIKEIKKWYET